MAPPPRNRNRSPHTCTQDLSSGLAKAPTPRASPIYHSSPASSSLRPCLGYGPAHQLPGIPNIWLRAHTVSSLQNVTSNHRANDTVVCEGRPQVLNGRFMYGPLDVVTLTGEKVRTERPWPRVDPSLSWSCLQLAAWPG